MFELFAYVHSCNALSARFLAVDRALNFYFMIMIMRLSAVKYDPLFHSKHNNRDRTGKVGN